MSTAAVKIRVTIAQPFVIAGTPFSLTTTVENVHEEKIDILEFLYHIPYQVQWIHDVTFNQAYDAHQKRKWFLRWFSSSRAKTAWRPPGEVMSFANRTATAALEAKAADSGAAAPRAPITAQAAVFELLPTESASYSFKAIVSKWLVTSGGELAFPGFVRYRYKGEVHFSPFEVRFTLRLRSSRIALEPLPVRSRAMPRKPFNRNKEVRADCWLSGILRVWCWR